MIVRQLINSRRRQVLLCTFLILFPYFTSTNCLPNPVDSINSRSDESFTGPLTTLSTSAYSYEGCYSQLSGYPTTSASLSGKELTVSSCITTCHQQRKSSTWALLQLNPLNSQFECRCSSTLSDYVSVNPADCSQTLSDGNPGGWIWRLSIYKILLDSSSTSSSSTSNSSSSTSSSSSSSSSPSKPSGVTSISSHSLSSMDISQILFIVIGTFVASILIGSVLYWLFKRNRQSKLPAKPSLEYIPSMTSFNNKKTSKSTLKREDDLIPGLLRSTSSMVYSVYQEYLANKSDELSIHPSDILIVKHSFMDEWALGFNFTTNESGIFPLICLIDVDLLRKSSSSFWWSWSSWFRFKSTHYCKHESFFPTRIDSLNGLIEQKTIKDVDDGKHSHNCSDTGDIEHRGDHNKDSTMEVKELNHLSSSETSDVVISHYSDGEIEITDGFLRSP